MSNPWDPPPTPSYADDDSDKTFCGVGYVMSAWETIEFELSRLHSVFEGDPDGDAMPCGITARVLFSTCALACCYRRWKSIL